MVRRGRTGLLAVGVVGALALAACGGDDEAASTTAVPETSASGGGGGGGECAETTKVKMTLQWVAQAQFAGNFAALDQGYYADACIDLELQPGGPDINAVQLLLTGDTDVAGWAFGNVLTARADGADVISIGQVFERSGYQLLSFADKGIEKVEDFKGKTVGLWGGFQPSFSAAAGKYGLEQDTDYTVFNQGFDMLALLNEEIDLASAMSYNEYAQALAGAEGRELRVFDFNAEGTATLQDTIATTRKWADENPEVAKNFIKATMKGWIYCRDNPGSCVDIVLKAGPALQENYQVWQMNEVNRLIWPSTNGLFNLTEAMYDQTHAILLDYGVITNSVAYADAVDMSFREKAVAELTDEDLSASGFTAEVLDPVELFAGG
jgi:NitT/TauT family transport system substrate-binding protein